MIVELIDQIKQGENQANKIIQEAKNEARDMIKGVEAAMAEQERNAMQENRQKLQNILDSVRNDFQKTMDNRLKANLEQRKVDLKLCEKNIPAVTDFIVERVMKHGDN